MIDGQLLQKIASFLFNILVSNQYSARVLPVDNCLIVPDGWLVNGIWVFVGLLGPMYHLSASPPELTIHSIHYCIEGNFHLDTSQNIRSENQSCKYFSQTRWNMNSVGIFLIRIDVPSHIHISKDLSWKRMKPWGLLRKLRGRHSSGFETVQSRVDLHKMHSGFFGLGFTPSIFFCRLWSHVFAVFTGEFTAQYLMWL